MVTLKDAKNVAESIVKSLHPISIVLFGSVAKNGEGADLDLLVVTDDEIGSTDAYSSACGCLEKFYERFAIEPFIITKSLLRDHYSKGSPFLRLILREGRLLYMKDIVNEWIKQAEEDLKVAEYLLEGGYFKSVCFHSQQSIEKSIKTVLLKEGWELEKIHSVRRLVSICKGYNIRIDISDDEITFIDSIYRGRYPAEAGLLPLGEPSEIDARKAVNMAERIFKTVQLALKK